MFAFRPRTVFIAALLAFTVLPAIADTAAARGLCTQPVPRVAFQLLAQAQADIGKAPEYIETVNHLMRRYCLDHDETPAIDYSESIGNKCIMYSGLLSGERVYWGECPPDADPFRVRTATPAVQPPPPQPRADTHSGQGGPLIPVRTAFWSHNGSIMKLNSDGARRIFVYQIPRDALRPAGVLPGTVLFEGIRRGDTYSGTAYVFSSRCGPLPYQVIGDVSPDHRQVTMYGRAPLRDDACRPAGERDDELVFTFHDEQDNFGNMPPLQ